MKKFKLEVKTVKKIIISTLLVIALVVQFAFLSYLFKAISPNKDKNNVIMDYTSSGNLDYKVYLKQNDFIDNDQIETGKAYILDLIDYIKITSLYSFKSTVKTNNPEVMTKEKVLDEKAISFNDSNYASVGSYDLYLTDYLNMIKDFQNQVKIAVDGYLEVSQVSEFSGTVGGASYNDNYSNTLKIPLSNSVVKIENINSKPKTKSVYESDLIKTNKTVMSYIVIANIITFIIICFLLKKLFTFTNKTEYQRELNKILKNYDDIIVNTNSIVDVSRYKIIEINEFKEILNLSRELLLPIMNYEMKKDEETWFYVLKDDIIYIYLVSKEKLENNQNKKKKSLIRK